MQGTNSHTINFELLNGVQLLSISFDTERPGRNLLMDVVYDGFYLDTSELPASHPLLYKTIKLRMEYEAQKFWKELREDQKEKFDKMPDVNDFFETIKNICEPYNQTILNTKNPL